MFQYRQIDELYQVEVSFVALSPGVVANNTTVGVAGACTLGAAGSANPATFNLGDHIEVFQTAGANLNGVVVTASPTATQGTAEFNFTNATGGGVTPTASAVYCVIAYRRIPTLVS